MLLGARLQNFDVNLEMHPGFVIPEGAVVGKVVARKPTDEQIKRAMLLENLLLVYPPSISDLGRLAVSDHCHNFRVLVNLARNVGINFKTQLLQRY